MRPNKFNVSTLGVETREDYRKQTDICVIIYNEAIAQSSRAGRRTYIGVGLSALFQVAFPLLGTAERKTISFSIIQGRLQAYLDYLYSTLHGLNLLPTISAFQSWCITRIIMTLQKCSTFKRLDYLPFNNKVRLTQHNGYRDILNSLRIEKKNPYIIVSINELFVKILIQIYG